MIYRIPPPYSQKGFTLLESLVAIAILLIAVVGPMSVIGRSLPQSAYARDHAIAVNLAQEGIEAIRQRRDSNMLNDWNGTPTAWDNGIVTGNYYAVDPRSFPMLILCGASCNATTLAVRQDVATGVYYQSSAGGGTIKRFQRYILIENGAIPQEKKITVSVTWQDSLNSNHTITASEYISGINS